MLGEPRRAGRVAAVEGGGVVGVDRGVVAAAVVVDQPHPADRELLLVERLERAAHGLHRRGGDDHPADVRAAVEAPVADPQHPQVREPDRAAVVPRGAGHALAQGAVERLGGERELLRVRAEEQRDYRDPQHPVILTGVSAIRLRGVVKRFGSLTAVDHLDLDVPEGTCVGLLGPNGAGKSTTMKLLTAQALADEGEIELLGYTLPRESKAARAECGVVPQGDNLDTTLTVEQNLIVFAHLYRIARHERRDAV